MITLKETTTKRISEIQALNEKISNLEFPKQVTKQEFTVWKKKIIEEETSRIVKEDDSLSYIKGIHLHTYKETLSIRQIFDLSLNIMVSLQFDIEQLQGYTQKQFQQQDLLAVLVEMFTLFFGFLNKYLQLKDNYRSIFRSNNKTLAFDIIKYITMFTRDYFQHLILALEKQLPYEVKIFVDRSQKKNSDIRKMIYKQNTEGNQIIKPFKVRQTKTGNILNLQQPIYHVQLMDNQQILKKSIEEYQMIKRRNAYIYQTRAEQKVYPNLLKIKINFNGLYSKQELEKLQSQSNESAHVRIFINEAKTKKRQKYQNLKRFVDDEIQKQMELFKKVKISRPVKITQNCKFALKFTNKLEQPLQLVLFEPHTRKSSFNHRFPSLKTTPSVSPMKRKKIQCNISEFKLCFPVSTQQSETQYHKSRQKRQVLRANHPSETSRKNSCFEKEFSLPRTKVIKMKSSTLILPTILKKIQTSKKGMVNPEDEQLDNIQLRDVMAFNKIKKPEKQRGSQKNLLGIITKQVYNIYI